MAVDPNTGEIIPKGKSPRFLLWLSFFAFATITLGSAVSLKNQMEEVNSNARWAVFCSAFSFATTGVVTLMHMSSSLSHYVIGTKIEGFLTLVLVAFWSGTVAVVANARSGLAVDNSMDNQIVNGNLYYFSWAGFVNSVILVVSYLRGVFGVDLYGEVQNRAARLTLWAGFLSCAMVVMGSSANIQDMNCNGYDGGYASDSSYCKRTVFGITVGAIGTTISLGVVALKMLTSMASLMVEAGLALILCILNGLGVAYLTSPAGPGSSIGNLYYFVWLSWLCSFFLIASIYEDFQGDSNEKTEEKKGEVDEEDPANTILEDTL